jgi:hypothetical protein
VANGTDEWLVLIDYRHAQCIAANVIERVCVCVLSNCVELGFSVRPSGHCMVWSQAAWALCDLYGHLCLLYAGHFSNLHALQTTSIPHDGRNCQNDYHCITMIDYAMAKECKLLQCFQCTWELKQALKCQTKMLLFLDHSKFNLFYCPVSTVTNDHWLLCSFEPDFIRKGP